MMGSQIRLYLTAQDQAFLGRAFVEKGNAKLLRSVSEIDGVVSLEPEELSKPVYGFRVLLARHADLSQIVFDKLGLGRGFVSGTSSSPVIDFDLGRVADRGIVPGRLYRWDNDDVNGELRSRPDDWKAWAKKIFGLCRRSLYRVDDRTSHFFGAYIGPEAKELWQSGRLDLHLNG